MKFLCGNVLHLEKKLCIAWVGPATHLQISTKTSRQSAGSEGPTPLGVGGLCSFVLPLLVSFSLTPVQGLNGSEIHSEN